MLSCPEAKPQDDAFVVLQREEIRFSIKYEREHQIRWRDLLRPQPEATKPLRRLILGAGTQFIQQFEVTLVEKWGRRGLMLISTAGQGFAFLIITILLRFGAAGGNRKAAEGPIVFCFLYYIAFGLGMLGIPWLYPTEINSIAMRTKGAAVAAATNWITNYVIVQITPIGIQNLGWRFWIVFTVLNAAFLPIIYLFYPETANRTLVDLDEHYRNNPPLIVISDKDAVTSKRPQKYLDHEEAQIERIVHEDGSNEVVEKKTSLGETHHVE
ncbi:hypothetical protein FJTKL_01810 [Diaporthe vaccinii]|uniref:Major facilitator superfamily (MFS) profile domain-containing protein n=1 Tax=Diaporthe vaccinii TaxID=105482 RepID=A0ABR4F4B8_9PEZI